MFLAGLLLFTGGFVGGFYWHKAGQALIISEYETALAKAESELAALKAKL